MIIQYHSPNKEIQFFSINSDQSIPYLSNNPDQTGSHPILDNHLIFHIIVKYNLLLFTFHIFFILLPYIFHHHLSAYRYLSMVIIYLL